MPGNGVSYAVRRRKKPLQKSPKPPPVKTNPSKRHRDRLNVELDRLTGLLPFSEEVRGRLDKLSVLRLSVGYLKVKRYFHAALQKRLALFHPANGRNGQSVSVDGVGFSEGELLLQALNGFVLVVTTDGTIFYTSPTIQDFLGFHQSDVIHQSVYDLIHVDDRKMFKCQLHFALNPNESNSDRRAEDGQSGSRCSSSVLLPQYIPPENSSFLERSFCCRLCCLLDNTSGFLPLNFNGRLKYLHLEGNPGADGTAAPPQLALFAIATPLQPPSVMEIRTKTLIFQSKHRMDFAPVGIDTRGKLVLGYSEIELVTTGSGYQFIHAGDMMYCADNHLRMIKTGDSGFTFFRLLTKKGHWLWVQATARIVFKGGKPDFIIARQKALTDEEGEEHLKQRRRQLPFGLATGEGVLYDVSLDTFSVPDASSCSQHGAGGGAPLDPASLLGSLHRQDHSVYTRPQKAGLPVFTQPEDGEVEQPPLEQAFLDSRALLSVPGQIHASPKRSVTADLTSDAIIDSLEQILGDIGDGGIEGFEVEETELRDWENTLIRTNNEVEDASVELNRILANDVFSYVEEALRRESGGAVLGSDHVSGSSLSIQGQRPGSVFPHGEPPVTDTMSGFPQQRLLGGVDGGGGGCWVGFKAAASQRHGAEQGHASRLWPPSSPRCGSQPVASAQNSQAVCSQPDVTQPSWLHNISHILREAADQREHTRSHAGSQLHSPPAWPQQQQQQQQLPQSFHHHTLTHSSHTPSSVNSAARPFPPQTQRLPSSCMYESREGHIPGAAAGRQNGPVGGRRPGFSPAAVQPGLRLAACADVGNISLVHVNGDGAASQHPPENGSVPPAFFCWNGDAQIPKVPLNGIVDPFAFPALPTGSVNLSRNTGP